MGEENIPLVSVFPISANILEDSRPICNIYNGISSEHDLDK